MSTEIRYGWFSAKQQELNGHFVYASAGNKWPVNVTMVTIKPEHGSNFDDIKLVGIVEEFLSSHPESASPANQVLNRALDDLWDDFDE